MANHEAIYRGEKVMKARESQQLVAFGVGAVGSQLVDHLSRIGFKKIAVFDRDRVDADNVFSQVYDRKEQGMLKVDAMKARVFQTTRAQLETEHRPVTRDTIGKIVKKYAGAIFIDCFDNEEGRQILFDNIKDCLHIGLAADYAEVVWNKVYRVPKLAAGVDVCNYPQARTVALMSVGIATESLISYMTTGKQNSFAFTLKDMRITAY